MVTLILGAGASARPQLAATAGLEWSTGDYGEARPTDILDSSFALKAKSGHWSIWGQTSFLAITGPANIAAIEGADSAEAPLPARRGTQAGLGDSFVGLDFTLEDVGGSSFYVMPLARVRLPTGSYARGLGVGATDAFLGLEFGVVDRGGGLSVRATRRFLGDTPDYERQNGWQLDLSAWTTVADDTLIGADFMTRESSFDGGTPVRDLDGYVVLPLNERMQIQLVGTVGLTRASPSVALASMLVIRF